MKTGTCLDKCGGWYVTPERETQTTAARTGQDWPRPLLIAQTSRRLSRSEGVS